jgi:hypothetical protein
MNTLVTVTGASAPVHLKMVKKGAKVGSYYSSNGKDWRLIKIVPFKAKGLSFLGLTANSADTSTIIHSGMDDVVLDTTAISHPPQILLKGFTESQYLPILNDTARLSLTATTSAAENKVKRVKFFVDDSLYAADSTAPTYLASIKLPADSTLDTVVIKATVYDTAGDSTSISYPTFLGTTSDTVLYSAADTYTRGGKFKNANYGTQKTVLVGLNSDSTKIYRAFVSFTGMTVDSVTSAKLRIYGAGSSSTSFGLVLFECDSALWKETTLKQSSQPSLGDTITTTSVASMVPDYVEFNVTNWVNERLAANKTSVAFAIVGSAASNTYFYFNSKTATEGRPELILKE